MLDSATEHYARQQRLTAAALLALRRERGGALAKARIIAAFQLLAARDAATAVPLMLEEQDIDAPPVGQINAAAVAGVAQDGRPLDTLVDYGLSQPPTWFDLMAASQVQDAARSAAGLSIATRPRVNGWVRMMNPPSCARCAVLAGKFFRWNQGFQRHPKCDCRHIPAQEADYSDVRLSGDKWFHELPSASELNAKYPDLTVKMRNEAGLYSQEDIFTKAGARAVRDGADLSQVVNARRGMDTIAYGNRTAVITREGVTSRGVAGKSLGGLRKIPGERYRRSTRPRVMPETIYAAAPSREEAIRLLKLNGFIF